MLTINYKDADAIECIQKLIYSDARDDSIGNTVREVLSDVSINGDSAVLKYTEKFDSAKLQASDLRVEKAEFEKAVNSLSAEEKTAIESSLASVTDFHKKTLPKSWSEKNSHGANVGEVFHPIQRVGLYVPGGSVPLVSSVIMTAALAKVAGVPSIAIATPPQSNGGINSSLLAAISICGVDEVYKVGGIQAIGAMAYGTESIPKVNKIFGPGNAFVIEAKRQVFGQVGIDLLPGPSEVLVIADETANPKYTAADLMAQAEHGSGKEKIYLVVYSNEILDEIKKEIELQLESLDRIDCIRKVLEKSTIAIVVENDEQAIDISNQIAAEHLELHVADSKIDDMTARLTTAGCILQGSQTPTVLGDFVAGPSHTLPTGGSGHFLSGLQATDFLRRTSTIRYDSESLQQAKDVVGAFSKMESLDAHGRSLTVRFD